MDNKKYDIIEENSEGRLFTVRFKQYKYMDLLPGDWSIEKNGCGPTSLATILASFGYHEDPISISKRMLYNEFGFLSSNYHEGVNGMSIIYCLNKLIEEGMDIEYKIVKINYDHPEWMKQKVIDMIKNGYMAIVNVGPNKNIFSQGGHYITVTSVNNNNQEFYVANSCNDGDKQIDITFSYEQIVKDIYKDNFDFLMIRKRLI